MKRVIFLIILFSEVLLHADCGHCYKLIHVKIILKNGKSMKGWIPYYGAYIDVEKVPLKKGANIKPNILAAKVPFIDFYKKVYSFKADTLWGVVKEEIVKINLKYVEKIIYLFSNPNYSGAGEPPFLSKRDVTLLSRNIYNIERIEGVGVCDYIYINCNPNLSTEEFKLFGKFMKHYGGDPSLPLIFRPNYLFKEIEKISEEIDSVCSIIKSIINSAKKETDFLSKLVDSIKAINQGSILLKYIEEFKNKYVKMEEFGNALLDFLTVKDEKTSLLFKQNLEKIFPELEEIGKFKFEIIDGKIPWEELKQLFNYVKKYYSGDAYEKICSQMIEECDIVFMTYSWD